MIKNLECLIPKVEAQMNERLIALWKEESSCGDIKSFSEFVRKYNVYFYTNNIIKTVYSSSGLTGNYQKWLDRFRATNNELELWSYVNILDTKSQTFLCCTSS